MPDFSELSASSNAQPINPQNISSEQPIRPENIDASPSILPPSEGDCLNDISSGCAEHISNDCSCDCGCSSDSSCDPVHSSEEPVEHISNDCSCGCDCSSDSSCDPVHSSEEPVEHISNDCSCDCDCSSDSSCGRVVPNQSSYEQNCCEKPFFVQPISEQKSSAASPPPAKTLSAAAICALCICTTLIFNIIAYAIAFSFFKNVSPTGQKYLTSSSSPSASAINNGFNASKIYEDNVNSIVSISLDTNNSDNYINNLQPYSSTGTGFIISDDGYILTNYHVVQSSPDITVTLYNGSSYNASLVGYDMSNDIAVIKIPATGLQTIKTGDSSLLKVGENICVIGNPLGELTYTLTQGGISALKREINVDGQPINMFQLYAAVSPGNSGGPVLNSNGEVVGIVTAKSIQSGVEGIGFAIAINDIVSSVNDIISYGYVKGRAYFGISVQPSVNPNGAYVVSVTPGSCAEKSGLKVGDVIIQLGETEITSSSNLISTKKSYKAGDSAAIKVNRNGEIINLTIIFDEETPDKITQNNNAQQQQQQQQQQEQEQEQPQQGQEQPQIPEQQTPEQEGDYFYNPFPPFYYFFR